ncbi:DNA-binding transcriptional LysR family regulator [Rhizobium leguminosarum]|uniref:DNA-binding transcriptional LysR family regulator n=1 Tax=Rhizobium leguminosarum TaxID=384 RepID=A0AAE2MFW3_RHILE|nr:MULTISPECIES: LysR substrate-binding domain-containing protein [Rhizobium]MBB4288594.1 DNA-binding transcriptional LysR family regulator [Rhizobium leguminosarum]MBB4295313.1 DNA-binding transcriptional LysR family regulator [Rhizobium leguminosarum]MBB4306706.1 DNA-binding transcriptional LysR family regulator [Rhizobium leguminosarum]MBB4417712.1 DNA-binding transcriptional LysR family regulator [Rhizobium leguminosarum]MBB4432558.1 DNA-binding transcriptional LysR family regulator [Rhizo
MRLPPLNAIRAFEAVCRHGSILKAAEELNVVRGAVRQQIATLENHVGRKLFTRDGRRLVPTVQASAFAAAAGAAFDILQRAASELEGKVPDRIRLGVPSAFAVWWLMPRVTDMQASLGDTAVDIVPMAVAEPLQIHPELDAVIMGGEYRPAAGITALRFMEDEFGPVVTAALAATLSSDPASMAALTMLASRSVPKLWDEWFVESGTPPVTFSRVQEFEDLLLALGAARSGLGVALAPRASIEDDLQRGRLVAPYGFISRPSGYSLCCRAPDAKRPAFAALSGWLLRCGISA